MPVFILSTFMCPHVISNLFHFKTDGLAVGQTPLATRTAPKPMTPVFTGGLTLFPESHFQLHPRAMDDVAVKITMMYTPARLIEL